MKRLALGVVAVCCMALCGLLGYAEGYYAGYVHGMSFMHANCEGVGQ